MNNNDITRELKEAENALQMASSHLASGFPSASLTKWTVDNALKFIAKQVARYEATKQEPKKLDLSFTTDGRLGMKLPSEEGYVELPKLNITGTAEPQDKQEPEPSEVERVVSRLKATFDIRGDDKSGFGLTFYEEDPDCEVTLEDIAIEALSAMKPNAKVVEPDELTIAFTSEQSGRRYKFDKLSNFIAAFLHFEKVKIEATQELLDRIKLWEETMAKDTPPFMKGIILDCKTALAGKDGEEPSV